MRWLRLFPVLCALVSPLAAAAQEPKKDAPPKPGTELAGLDEYVANVLKDWKVPGIALGVVKDGQVLVAKGYGLRNIDKQLPVTPHTLFAIGSITKSFTVTGLALLADEGRLDWDAPVRTYLPDFQLFDKQVTLQATPRDLVTHRSGLPRHDYLWYAAPQLTRRQLYERLRYLEPNKEFRAAWQYQNLMYMTAGLVTERIAGKSWEEFTRERIVRPLGMEHTNFSVTDSQKADDFALPYSLVKDQVRAIPFHNIDAIGPAGSINSNIEAMIRYLQFHMNGGRHGTSQLLSVASSAQMQSPQMVVPSASSQFPRDEELGEPSYGMGFVVSSYRGHKLVEHGGAIDGFVALVSFLPRKKIGVVVLTNLSGSNSTPAVLTRSVYDRLLGVEPADWSARLRNQTRIAQAAQEAAKKGTPRKEGTQPSHAIADFTGTYEHPAYGTVKIRADGSQLALTTQGGQQLALRHFHYDIFEIADEDGRFDKQKVSFRYNKNGDIDQLAVSLEPAVSDILFGRVADESMRQRQFLEPLAGEYVLFPQLLTVALRDDRTLLLTVPGQPVYELVPRRDTTFDLKGLPGYSVSFQKESGVWVELTFHQPNGTFVARRKGAAGAVAQARTLPATNSKPAGNGHAAPPARPAPTAWTPELMLDVRRVTHVRPSPDGKRVAYAASTAVATRDQSEYVSHLVLANADGSNAVQLTHGNKSSSDPQWSPDGQYLAFTSNRSGKTNLYVIRVAGGESEALTDVTTAVGTFKWSPLGEQIAFTMSDAPSAEEERAAREKDDWRWVEEDPKMTRLYVVSLAGRTPGRPLEPRLLTPGAFSLGGPTGSIEGSFDWAPDGRSIAFAHQKSAKADDWTTSDVSLVELAGGAIRPVAATAAAESRPLYSPDGKWIALVTSDTPPTWAGDATVQIVPAAGGSPKPLPATFDRRPNPIGWSADGSRIYFEEARGTANRIYAFHIGSNDVSEISAGEGLFSAISLNASRTAFGFAWEWSDRAPEAYVTAVAPFAPVAVSRVNAGLPSLPLGKVEIVRWKASDGLEIEGLLTYPVGYEPGRRVPLLLNVHGGPSGVFSRRYLAGAGLYPLAAFAARGYAVLQPNPRGSSGYGKKFRYANYRDWGGADYRDLMAGVDHVIALGVADPERLGVMGWSYGGYMTSWTITQTRRFKAASVGAAVTNLASFTGTADIPAFLPDYLGAQPWETIDLYRGRSAVFQAKGVTTPTLIQHGEADVRVPVSQGYEFYNALKQQGVPARMLVLPRQPHGPNEPKMLLKIMQTNLDWFDQYLKR